MGTSGRPILPEAPPVEDRPEILDAVRGAKVPVFMNRHLVSIAKELFDTTVRVPAVRDDEAPCRDVVEEEPIRGRLLPVVGEPERNLPLRGALDRSEHPELSAMLRMPHARFVHLHDALECAGCLGEMRTEERQQMAHALRRNLSELCHLSRTVPLLPAPDELPECQAGKPGAFEPRSGEKRELLSARPAPIPIPENTTVRAPTVGTHWVTIRPDAGADERERLCLAGWMGDGIHTNSMKDRERTVALDVPSG